MKIPPQHDSVNVELNCHLILIFFFDKNGNEKKSSLLTFICMLLMNQSKNVFMVQKSTHIITQRSALCAEKVCFYCVFIGFCVQVHLKYIRTKFPYQKNRYQFR